MTLLTKLLIVYALLVSFLAGVVVNEVMWSSKKAAIIEELEDKRALINEILMVLERERRR